MTDRVTLAGLEALALDGSALVFKVVYLVRGTKTMCYVEVAGVGASPVVLAGTSGAVRYWSGVGAALADIVQAARSVSGNYTLHIEGAGILPGAAAQSVASYKAEVDAALITNSVQTEAANGQIALLADVPAMVACLEAERGALEARRVALLGA